MNRPLACVVLFALGAAVWPAADTVQAGPADLPSAARPEAGEDCLNIALAGMLDAGGGYVRLEGGSLFLTSNLDPKAPRPGFWFDVAEGLAYATSNNGLAIVDITDPAAPKLVESVEIPGGIRDVAVLDGYVFVAAGKRGIRVFDVSDPARPRQIGRCPGKLAAATELAVLRSPCVQAAGKQAPAQTTAAKPAASPGYSIYAAAPRAAILRFHPPARKGKTR